MLNSIAGSEVFSQEFSSDVMYDDARSLWNLIPFLEAHMKGKFAALALIVLSCLCITDRAQAQTTPPPLPNPVLYLLGQESFSSSGKLFVRYRYGVLNSSSYPDTIFAAAPALPPCGKNTNAARTWVDVLDQRGKRLFGFCAFGKSDDLNSIWFALEEGNVPPSWVYIEMTDRQTGTKYKSNLAETTN